MSGGKAKRAAAVIGPGLYEGWQATTTADLASQSIRHGTVVAADDDDASIRFRALFGDPGSTVEVRRIMDAEVRG